MKMTEFLMKEYKRWIDREKVEDTSENRMKFLNEADMIREYDEQWFNGIVTESDRCVLRVDLYTDKDYSVCHDDMSYDNCWYQGIWEWDTSESECKEQALKILRDIRESVVSDKPNVKSMIKDFISNAEHSIMEDGYVRQGLSGSRGYTSSIVFDNTVSGNKSV